MTKDTFVPMIMRDDFFDDPFFKSTWEHFEKLREKMWEESRDWWNKVDQDFNKHSMIDREFRSEDKKEEKKTSLSSRKNSNSQDRAVTFWDKDDDFFRPFPRRWMLPSLSQEFKDMDVFQSKDSEVIRVKEDDKKMEVSLDTSQYRPDELSVSVSGGVVSVEGKHEEKAEDGSKMVSRQFCRQYTLPQGAKPEDVESNLSSDGVLVVTARKANQKSIDVKIRKP